MASHSRLIAVLLFCVSLLGCAQPGGFVEHWGLYKQRFVSPEGRVLDSGNRGISHSEGQGWGMLFAEAAGDRQAFERIWQWTSATLLRSDVALFAWRYDPAAANPVADPNNASDGDLLIAWALQRASERWQAPGYAAQSQAIRRAIDERLIRQQAGYTILLPGLVGFEREDGTVVNLSYWVLPAIQHFARLEPDAGWQRLLTDAPRLLAAARFGPHDLPPDWLVLPSHGAPQPAQGWPPRFGFDAVRVPLYFHWGGADAALLEPIRRYWAGSGEPMPAWVDLRDGSVADFPASLGVEAIQAVLDGRELPPAAIVQDDYYAASLYLLSWLARSSPR